MRDSYLLISYCQIEAWYFISLSSRHNADQWGLESLPAVYPNCYKLFFVWLSKFNNWMECSNIIVDSRYLDICLIEVMVDTWQLRNRRAGLHSSHSPVWALQCASVPVHYGGSIWIMSYTYRVTGLKEATREERKKWTTCEGRWVLLFTWCLSRLHLRISPLLRAGLQECEWREKPRHRVVTVPLLHCCSPRSRYTYILTRRRPARK